MGDRPASGRTAVTGVLTDEFLLFHRIMEAGGPLDGRVVSDRSLAKGSLLGPLGPPAPKGATGPGGLDALAAIAARARDEYPAPDKSKTLPVSIHLNQIFPGIPSILPSCYRVKRCPEKKPNLQNRTT